MNDRIGDWIQTASGRAFYVLDPRPEDVASFDIAHGLAAEPRFNGQTPAGPYSVAQHSVLVSLRVEELTRGSSFSRETLATIPLVALLHDASEAYVKDIPRPLKGDLLGYKAIEERVMSAIFEHYHIGDWLPLPSLIRRADDEVLASEASILHPIERRPQAWNFRAPVLHHWDLEEMVTPWGFEHARRVFLQRLEQLVCHRLWEMGG